MVNRYGAIASFSIAAITIGFFIAASSAKTYAIPLSRAAWPIYTVVVKKTTPPDGWADFCRNYRPECDVQSSPPMKIVLTPERETVVSFIDSNTLKQLSAKKGNGETLLQLVVEGGYKGY
jgi:predicted transglutaminase-like cysteine proteinase